MEIELSPEDQERVQLILSTGKFPDEQAVIHAALLALKEREERKRAMREAAVQPGNDETPGRD
jgi:Arc/MetJ-type ribon-helix-helix transcriptional regulator